MELEPVDDGEIAVLETLIAAEALGAHREKPVRQTLLMISATRSLSS